MTPSFQEGEILNFREANHWSKVRHSARRAEKGRLGSGAREIHGAPSFYPQLGLFSVSPPPPTNLRVTPYRVRAQITKPWGMNLFPNTAPSCCLVSAAPQPGQLHPQHLPTLTLPRTATFWGTSSPGRHWEVLKGR